MIIKGGTGSTKKKPFVLFLFLGVALLGIAIWAAYAYGSGGGNRSKGDATTSYIIKCDAENITSGQNFITNGVLFNNGQTQSTDKAYKGKYASKLDNSNAYSFGSKYTNFEANDEIEMTVWYKSNNSQAIYLVAQSIDPEFYIQSNEDSDSNDGWHQKQLVFKVPNQSKLKELSLFAYNAAKKEVAYLDEFTITNRTQELVADGYTKELDIETAQLHFSVKALDKLKQKRSDALNLGLLVKGDNDWVKAKFKTDKKEEVEVKARLKGDWTDHLKGDRWSYRIKMPSGEAWNRITTFSLQNPVTRDYLSEWVFHKLLASEDILTPRYDFINLKINDSNTHVYAYEEHFEKQIAEFKNRREGVIIRYSEEEFWDARKRDKELGSGYFHALGYYHYQAPIEPFGGSKIAKSEKLMEQFNAANNLLHGFQLYDLSVNEAFDIDRLAKYYAICEITRAYHSTIWHNMRFYYNPIIKKLEPIGFDGFTDTGAFDFHKNAFLGAYRSSSLKDKVRNPNLYLFQDQDFNSVYTQYLKAFSSKSYIDQFLKSIALDLNEREKMIQNEKPNYNYNKKELYKTAKNIQAALKVTTNISLRAYKSSCTNDSCDIQLTNNHALPLEYLGSSKSNKKLTNLLHSPLMLHANRRIYAKEYKTVRVPKEHKYVHYRLGGGSASHHSEIKAWPAPQVQKGRKPASLQIPLDSKNYHITEDKVTIKIGHYKITNPIIIPSGKHLEITAGTTLDFTKGAYLLSYSPVTLDGTESNPITITSSDKNNQGFHVLDADSKSTLSYTQFLQLNTLSEGDWQLTGAVTFYESPVDLLKVTISHNTCEDALNLIRTDFTSQHLHINHTFADGFDADFCSGTMTDSRFYNTGNDGIDFSGSTIKVENIVLQKIGDKGISAGEQATLTVINANIEDAIIGVASKDLSKVTITDIKLTNCNKGFAAYQKKPEFGPGTITVEKYTAEEVKFLQIAENNSIINLPKTK